MAQPLNFQQAILKLHEYWAAQGCVIWEPYNVQVGAGTGNPATLLRVLGPEPWRVAYVEPSVRPDDDRARCGALCTEGERVPGVGISVLI